MLQSSPSKNFALTTKPVGMINTETVLGFSLVVFRTSSQKVCITHFAINSSLIIPEYFLTHPGDVICVFSQYGEIVNINLIRDKKTGKQKGFCFICYEDQRSTVLAVDNLNGIKVRRQSSALEYIQ